MSSFLIDPDTHTVTVANLDREDDFLDSVRAEIGAMQLVVLPIAENRAAVWADAFGMLKPGRNFWRFNDTPLRFAGRCVLTALSPNGLPTSFPESLTAEEVATKLAWHPSESMVALTERLVVVEDEYGRPSPVIARDVTWTDEPPELPADEDAGWTIFERPDGTYKALRYALQDSSLMPSEMLTATSLDDLRAQLPPGLRRIEPEEGESTETVEHWING